MTRLMLTARYVIVMTAMMLVSGCVSISTFKESIVINAEPSTVFRIIADFECYDELFPDLHDEVIIVSEIKQGKEVVWESVGSFKGVKFTTTRIVTDFAQDRMIRMEDVENDRAFVVLSLEALPEHQTRYTMSLSTKMYKPYEQEFFEIYKKEMRTVKREAERISTATDMLPPCSSDR